MSERKNQRKGGVLEKSREQTKRPQLYRVLLHNDDYTAMDFVTSVLEGIFSKSPAEAYRVMMQVHQHGVGTAGIYPHEVAETKTDEVHRLAAEVGYPLRASVEQE